MKHGAGDKVRVKTGPHAGERGLIERVVGDVLHVRIAPTAVLLRFRESELTNFSLAARRAWRSMPTRRVGRPRGTSSVDRLSVTLRIDRELWKQFLQAEEEGSIVNRTATINAWIADGLRSINAQKGEGRGGKLIHRVD